MVRNKNAFQYDAYRPPACSLGGGGVDVQTWSQGGGGEGVDVQT